MQKKIIKSKSVKLANKTPAKSKKRRRYSKKFTRFAQAVTNKFFSLILLPTEKCNFRCTYCYEDFKLGQMSPQTVEAIKQLISKRAALNELSVLSVGWFGGEPLLAKKVVFDICEHAKKESKNEKKFRLSGGMTTNGYLLDRETFDKLVKLKCLNYQISLDGAKDVHDTTRIQANGKGSFDRIWENMLNIKKSRAKFHITFRVHVTPTNIESVKILLGQIRDAFKGDKRFSVFIRNVANLGGENGPKLKTLDPQKDKEIIDGLYEILGNKDVRPYHIENKKTGPYICYAAQPNSLVIRADGSLAKCTVAFKDNVNCIGKINEDGTLAIDNEKVNLWAHWLKNMDYSMLKCPYSSICQSKRADSAAESKVPQTLTTVPASLPTTISPGEIK